ncbi:MAG: DNA gyrase subunit A [Elusimicrobiota bacterium]
MVDEKIGGEEKDNQNGQVPEKALPPNVFPRDIEEEMKTSYIDYAMSVIVGRALPDVRDGLKPVHRRILYAMKEMGLNKRSAYKKSARVVGDVLGKYHPHGDSSVYDALVRMVQDFSLRYTLIDGQGNFGSLDGDPPAAMRYTEVRMDTIADELLIDIDKNTVDFVPNYDGSMTEPTVLPARLPNLLVNGSSGIAVGMATNIPPHNLVEIIDGINLLIENPAIEIAELAKVIKGPDFPTGGIIYGKSGIKSYLETGRGSITIRAKAEIEDIKSGKQAIIINEMPYQVNKAQLLSHIAELVRDKKLEDISDLRDESDRDGVRAVIEIKRDGNAQIVLNNLYKHTQMEVSFGVIMLALVNNKPRVLNIKEVLEQYIEYRKVIIVRRTKFELDKADKRAHILEGLRIALDNLDKIIRTIREAKDTDTAREELMLKFKLSKVQSQAILDMRLQQLTGLERKKLEDEYLELIKTIERLKLILSNQKRVLEIIKTELAEIRDKYGDKRKTAIVARTTELTDEDLILKEDVVVSISHAGYIKRIPVNIYRSQRRGGKGITGVIPKEEDFVEDMFVTSTHAYVLFFTNKGRVYWLKVYEIPEASRQAKGKALVNLIRITSEEKVTAYIPVESFENEARKYLLMITKQGTVKKTELVMYSNPRPSGIIAIGLDTGDELIDVKLTDGKQKVFIATRNGKAALYKDEQVRNMGRGAKGVRGIRLEASDIVVGADIVTSDDVILTVTDKGYGKRTEVSEYRLTNRGAKGVTNLKSTDKNGCVVGIRKVNTEQDLMIMTTQGMAIRVPIRNISIIGRATQGVRLIRLDEGDKIAAVASIVKEEEATNGNGEGNGTPPTPASPEGNPVKDEK